MPAYAEIANLGSTATLPTSSANSDLVDDLDGGTSTPATTWSANTTGGSVPGARTDFKAATATVKPANGGAPWKYAEVVSIHPSSGIIPGKAIISIRNIDAVDEVGPITLSGVNYAGGGSGNFGYNKVKFWSRIDITSNGQTIFTGALLKRRDSIDGNSIVLEYWDDRWLLSGIPLRGCICYDPYDQQIKLIPRLSPHFNPNGYKNMTPIAKNSPVCVFILPAERGTLGKDDETSIGNNDIAGGPGTAVYATPERAFLYFWYAATVFNPTGTPYARNFARLDTSKLTWNMPTFQDGTMRAKMPDSNFRGLTMLGGIKRVLDISGEYDLAVDYQENALITYRTSKGATNQNNTNTANGTGNATTGITLNLQRNGSVTDIKTIVKGTAETDASEMRTAQLVEGAPFRIESRFQYSAAKLSGDTLSPAWTSTEQAAFLKIIRTGMMPNGSVIPGATDNGDGTSSFKNTIQAVQIARLCYPKVFRALQIDPSVSGQLAVIMAGVNNSLAAYPYNQTIRAPMNEQLQPYFEDATTNTNRGRLRLPIRIQVSDINVNGTFNNDSNTNFHDVTFNAGLRVTNDGLIWLDGLTDDQNLFDNIVDRPLVLYGFQDTAPYTNTTPVLRALRINMAIEHDARLFAQRDLFIDGADYNVIADQVDSSLAPKKTGAPYLQHFILNPEGFVQEQQLSSYPALPGSFNVWTALSEPQFNEDGTVSVGGITYTQVPLTVPATGYVYDNAAQIGLAAARHQKDCARFKRTNSFTFPGIRIDLNIGDYVRAVKLQGEGNDFLVNAPIVKEEYNFQKQETVVETE